MGCFIFGLHYSEQKLQSYKETKVFENKSCQSYKETKVPFVSL
jgi:hypothetical protein